MLYEVITYRAYTRMSHDVGGEPDIPIPWEEKEEEVWEHNTFVTCEVLAWRGVWNAEERRRRQNVRITSYNVCYTKLLRIGALYRHPGAIDLEAIEQPFNSTHPASNSIFGLSKTLMFT